MKMISNISSMFYESGILLVFLSFKNIIYASRMPPVYRYTCLLLGMVKDSTLLYYISQVIWVSKYRYIDDRHRNPNINIKEIIWLGNQLLLR